MGGLMNMIPPPGRLMLAFSKIKSKRIFASSLVTTTSTILMSLGSGKRPSFVNAPRRTAIPLQETLVARVMPFFWGNFTNSFAPWYPMFSSCLIGLSFLLLLGCSNTPAPKPLEFSGFLENYSGLRPAPDESGAWTYRKPGVDFRFYTKVMLDPLVIWPSRHSNYRGMDPNVAWRLAYAFKDRMHQALAGGYRIVKQPGPGVLRIRTALTDVVLQRPGVKSPGPLIPLANDIVLHASEKVSGMNVLAGEAAIEAEALDGQTYERLAAFVEKRVNSRVVLTNAKDSLGPILEIFTYWTKRFRQRLDEARGLRDYQKNIQ